MLKLYKFVTNIYGRDIGDSSRYKFANVGDYKTK